MNGRRWSLVVGLLLLTWLLITRDVTQTPLVHEDEPWIAAHAWGLASEGQFGAQMFAGLYGLERRTYEFMPVYALLQAGIFWGAGLSLLTARYLSLAAGVLTAALTFRLGRELFGLEAAVAGVLFLLFWSIAGPLPNRPAGIPLVDTARIARYDALVPVFGLAAWGVGLAARRQSSSWPWFGAGLLTALAGLTHIYGVFWLAPLLVIAVPRAAWPALLAGFCLLWLLYAGYVLSDLETWRQQFTLFRQADRFTPFDPGWYWRNLWREPLRYLPGLTTEPGRALLWRRPGVYGLLIGVPAGVLSLWPARDGARRAVLLPLFLLPALLALLISPKVPAYLLLFWPLVTLALGAAVVGWFQNGTAARRLLLGMGVALLVVTGGARLEQAWADGRGESPYDAYTAAIAEALPPQGLVLGLQRTWLGLADREYRSWIVPVLGREEATPAGLVSAVADLDPSAVIVDADMAAYFVERPAEWLALEAWLIDGGFGPPVVIVDETYGRTAVYRRGGG